MTDTDKPANPIALGNELQLTGPHWTFITKLYGSHSVQQACLLLQDSFSVDVSFLLTLLWHARDGVGFDNSEIEALDDVIAPWRSDVVKPLRTMRREIKPVASLDDFISGYRNKIKSIEIEAEQIEIAMLMRAMGQRKLTGVSGKPIQSVPIARTVETVLAFYAARARLPAAQLQTTEVKAAINVLADAAVRVNGELR
jgi:uncharacterized protein (TIGR02444 family)